MKRLGVFGGLFDWNECRPLVREALRGITGYLDADEAPRIAEYLRGGAILDAWMEYTRDLVSDGFGCSGGSATMTDGDFVWRADTADYVEIHRVALPLEFLEHGRRLNWTPPKYDREQQKVLYSRYKAEQVEGP